MGIMSLADLASTLTPDHLPKPAARSPSRLASRVLIFAARSSPPRIPATQMAMRRGTLEGA